MKRIIPFNLPYVSGTEISNFKEVIKNKKFSGRGIFTKKCEDYLIKHYDRQCLLTTSCTHALETTAFLLNFKKNDEIIVPSYTFVSTANAFAIRGAKVIFSDSYHNSPCIDPQSIIKKITKKTVALCIVHYAGISCDMKEILKICKKHNLKLIEDCAHSFDAFGSNQKLGTFGDFATLSFHDTKNIISGEGGALLIKKKSDYERARVIIEKGTNRSKFIDGKIKKYSWVSFGSSYELSEINACFLNAQLKKSKKILKKRITIFNFYKKELFNLVNKNYFLTPYIPSYAKVNGHIFYILLNNNKDLINLKNYAKLNGVILQDHYECLHKSPFINKSRKSITLPNSEMYASRLLRLPIYPSLTVTNMKKVVRVIKEFFNTAK